MNKEVQNKFSCIGKHLGSNDPNEILGEIYLHVVEQQQTIKSLGCCGNCEFMTTEGKCREYNSTFNLKTILSRRDCRGWKLKESN